MNPEENPYEHIATQQVYVNPWIKVREDKVMRPDGRRGIFGVITVNDGVSVLPIDEEGNVYLIEEFQYAANKPTLLTISGGIDKNEQPLEAAQRELKEESGIVAQEWIDLGTVESMTMIIDCTMHLYIARGLTFGEADLGDQKTINCIKMPLDEAVEMVMASQIAPAAGNVLILRADHYLKADQ